MTMDLSNRRTFDDNELVIKDQKKPQYIVLSIVFFLLLMDSASSLFSEHNGADFFTIIMVLAMAFGLLLTGFKVFDNSILVLINQNGIGYTTNFIDTIIFLINSNDKQVLVSSLFNEGIGYKPFFYKWEEIEKVSYEKGIKVSNGGNQNILSQNKYAYTLSLHTKGKDNYVTIFPSNRESELLDIQRVVEFYTSNKQATSESPLQEALSPNGASLPILETKNEPLLQDFGPMNGAMTISRDEQNLVPKKQTTINTPVIVTLDSVVSKKESSYLKQKVTPLNSSTASTQSDEFVICYRNLPFWIYLIFSPFMYLMLTACWTIVLAFITPEMGNNAEKSIAVKQSMVIAPAIMLVLSFVVIYKIRIKRKHTPLVIINDSGVFQNNKMLYWSEVSKCYIKEFSYGNGATGGRNLININSKSKASYIIILESKIDHYHNRLVFNPKWNKKLEEIEQVIKSKLLHKNIEYLGYVKERL